MNLIGLITALSTFLSIWLGHIAVRKIEARSARLWPPMLAAVLLGLGCIGLSLASPNPLACAALGILGVTFVWDALEFRRQDKRVRRGHAPANPNNPRHAAYLRAGSATTTALLKREPNGGEA